MRYKQAAPRCGEAPVAAYDHDDALNCAKQWPDNFVVSDTPGPLQPDETGYA
ncbi:hypothetical protein ROP_53740 [Rhodococcus opacus B4]|uniref:Uncharacterized protein n=1 Tax=Rhodococcus opacus (strain B4) TaxID=632772 RepID=C1AVD1_RHOOB|nr:hypothetical protein ROP_53740 [Rhodococcus opacus B4]